VDDCTSHPERNIRYLVNSFLALHFKCMATFFQLFCELDSCRSSSIKMPDMLNGSSLFTKISYSRDRKRSAILIALFYFFIPCVSGADVPVYAFTIVNTFPHDPAAFTQGLVLDGKALYEGTGLYGSSSLRKVDLKTGKILKIHKLPPAYFGEGITVVGNRIIQLTWTSRKGFVYEKDSFRSIEEFGYETEGWGITFDGRHLIMSDGTPFLRFLDPNTFKLSRTLPVRNKGQLLWRLNELEYINGEIYANILEQDIIARISPETGEVTAWIDLGGLRQKLGDSKAGVLNGIAYNPRGKTLLVTGKNWPRLFEIKIRKK
jgi:glutaminyl-peptide cyclotransferase